MEYLPNDCTTGWELPSSSNRNVWGLANLREDYIPGDLGFDPFSFCQVDGVFDESSAKFKSYRTKELKHGRLAMVAIAGLVGQEVSVPSYDAHAMLIK
jgi:hypothetical protein